MLTTNKQQIVEVYDCVKQFHSLEEFPKDLPNPQNSNLLPTLRPYQVKAVKWMLSKELYPTYYERLDGNNSKSEAAVLLPTGGILAEEMGLGKTVEVLACILSNPRHENKMELNSESSLPIEEKPNIKLEGEVVGMEIVQSGDEFHPTEDGIVEIESPGKKESEDFVHGLSSLSDSSHVTDVDVLIPNKVNIKKEDVEEESIINIKRRGKKRKQPSLTSLNLDSGTLNSEESVRLKKHVRFDMSSVSSNSRKRNRDSVSEGSKSSMDTTIDEVIVKYCYDGVPPRPKKRREAAVAGEKLTNYMMLHAWYEDCLSQTSLRTDRTKRFQQQSSFQCCCVEDVVSDNVVQCPKCKTWQHAECVGFNESSADHDYYCFRCWVDQPPVPSAGTVIISPEAISQQWVSEIEKHIKKERNLNVLVYEGVRVNGYIQPYDLASYDIIITTYQVLTRELNYTEPVKRMLRHAKRFYAPTSPLLFVQWWRLCLDEAQMVEGSSSRAAEMANKFTAINKWAVTGTPIQKAVNDLVGLMEFLAGDKYPEFMAFMRSDWRSLLKLVPRVLWRSQMKDVLAEVGVPPQTVETHLLDFSKIEKYFYKCTHTECSQQFVNKITCFEDLSIPLKSLDRRLIGSLLNPLLKLRQACLHPQAVRGKFMSFKKTMTMDDLVSQMVTNAKLDAEQALRQLVATLNGMGALHLIRNEWIDAVAAYRSVLHLEQEHSGRLKIDSLQRIHTMYNLAEVLDGKYDGIPPTLRDEKLREDIKALELRYLGKRETPITATESRVDTHAGAVAAHLGGATLGYSEWWLRLLEWTNDRDELLDRLKSAIQHTDVKQKNQYNALANKLKSLYIVRVELARWLAELDRVRGEVCRWLRDLRIADTDLMASEALCCHLPQGASIKNRTRCSLCKAETVLKSYEALLFEERIIQKRNNKRNLPGSSDWTKDKDLDNKEISHLVDVNVNTFETNFKGGFKASPFEKILKALATYGRQKQAPSDWLKEAAHHITLLDKIKKEFLDLNLLWRQICDLVDAKDELNMCKMRIRLPYLGEEEQLEGKKKKKIGDNHHIIQLYRVEPELMKLKGEKIQYETLLKKRTGTLCYLETLQKEGAPAAICPVCRNDLTDKWSVLQCGHCLCLECLSLIIKPLMVNLQCPQCRQSCCISAVSYVESQSSSDATTATTTTSQSPVKGSYSTKVEAIVGRTLALTCQQPDVKILVFSAWEKVLDLLAEAFGENGITFRRLKSGKVRHRQCIKDFKTDNVTVLLLPLRSGGKGLNLVEATHVFLVEPILNPADELQAVGRVHRIGQTRPTVVHRFIIRETIEERILAAVAASGVEQWSDDCITLQQLFDLFSSDCELSLTLSQSEGDLSTSVATVDNEDEDSNDSEDDQEPMTLQEFDSDSDDH